MRPRGVHLGIAALVLGRDVRHVVGQHHELLAPVVRLADDALLGLGDVVLEPDDVLEPERPPDVGRDLDRLVVDRVAPVEAAQRRAAVVAGEQLGADQRPQGRIRVVVAHEHADLELDVDAQPVEQVPHQHRARVEVEHLAHAVGRVVAEQLVGPQQRVVVGLPHAAEVAGDRRGAVEVDVGAVGALGVEGLDHAGADDLHRRVDGREVAVGLLLGHLADADPAAGHQRALVDRPAGGGRHPREVLEGADLEGHRDVVPEAHPVGARTQDAAPVVRHGYERALVAPRLEPFEVGEVLRVCRAHPVEQRGQRARLARPAVDLVGRPVAGHHLEQVVDDPGARVQEQGVELREASIRDRQEHAGIECHGHDRLLQPLRRPASGRARRTPRPPSRTSARAPGTCGP